MVGGARRIGARDMDGTNGDVAVSMSMPIGVAHRLREDVSWVSESEMPHRLLGSQVALGDQPRERARSCSDEGRRSARSACEAPSLAQSPLHRTVPPRDQLDGDHRGA